MVENGTAVLVADRLRDEGCAWHWSDPLGEQRLIAQGLGSLAFAHRTIISITGPERLSYLHSLTTQHLTSLAAGASALTLNLTMQGFVLHEMHVIDDGATAWVIAEADARTELFTYLTRMRFRLELEVVDHSDDMAVVWQPIAEKHDEFLTWVSPYGSRWPARELIVPRDQVVDVVGGQPVGIWAYNAMRIAAGIPRQGYETDHHTLAHELGWIDSAVHLNKGCYRGQETVSKVARMGQPPRRLTLLHFDGTEETLPVPGTDVSFEGKNIGFLGTAAWHYELGPIGLAVIKRNVAEESVLDVLTMKASQEIVVNV
jgi:folate-binding protein YgfZ